MNARALDFGPGSEGKLQAAWGRMKVGSVVMPRLAELERVLVQLC